MGKTLPRSQGWWRSKLTPPLTIVAVQLCADDNLFAARLAHRRLTEGHRETIRACGPPMQQSTTGHLPSPKDELKACANPTKGACLDVRWPVFPSLLSPSPSPRPRSSRPPVSTNAPVCLYPPPLSACPVLHTPAPAKRSPFAHGPCTHEQWQFLQLVEWMARHLPRLAQSLHA